ncbi:MAG: hypothetical protein B6D36_16640 [Planctomycetes bacterium UTPLA1]|jgi:hypothetical protein|nr:MAG: hypothetical protein B6D36_16640 [Planctomycetes bacterium UTPLA1]
MRCRISYLYMGNITGCGHNGAQGLCRSGLEAIGMTHIAEGQIDEAAPTTGPPGWDAITEEIACPLCEYNLRGLAEPRCPECGYRFGWREMLDPTQRLHPYLFEHHPERNVWSFFKTFAGHLRPIRFWRRLHPGQPSHPGRIVVYWLYIAAVFFLSVGTLLACLIPLVRANNTMQWNFMLSNGGNPKYVSKEYLDQLTQEFGSIEAYLAAEWPVTTTGIVRRILFGQDNPTGAMVALLLMWPWLTQAIFIIFRRTLNRTSIRLPHLMRIVVYSCDVITWPCVGVFIVLAIVGITWTPGGLAMPLMSYLYGWLVLFGMAAIVWAYRLIAAFKYYLRFERPVSIVLISQLILILTALNIFLVTVLW